MFRTSYVVLARDTVRNDTSTIVINSDLVDYKYPIALLEKNKNLVYASDSAEIFK